LDPDPYWSPTSISGSGSGKNEYGSTTLSGPNHFGSTKLEIFINMMAGEHTRTRTVMTSKVGEDDELKIIIMMAGEHTRTRTVMTSKVGGRMIR
jgi:hypothetical protein